ncbi:glycosyltransferase family 4 protein [Ornithinimicrobium sp. W1665]|uniref:glycosyltransferase family 4 protein n=1 Tax=Ornithinimicrobium sp. W1665 TaxID=3416666 RepID=UPI003CF9FA99
MTITENLAPFDGGVVPTTSTCRVVAVAADAAELDEVARPLRGISRAGHEVVLVWWRGEPGERLRSFPTRRQVVPPAGAPSPVRAVRRLAGRVEEPGFPAVLQADTEAVSVVAGATAVVVVGSEASAAEDQVAAGRPRVGPEELAWWRGVANTWKLLDKELQEGGTLDAEVAEDLLARIDLLGGRVPPEQQGHLLPLVRELHRSGRYAVARRLVEHLLPGAAPDEGEAAMRRGLQALVRTSADGAADEDLREASAELLRRADDSLERGRLGQAVELATLALQLLFHRELHADELSSPLVEDPDGFLADLRASRVGALLGEAVPQEPPLRPGDRVTPPAGDGTRPLVLLSPGTFGQFATGVADALGEGADVRLVELAARPDLRWLGVSKTLVEKRLRQALGRRHTTDLELRAELERCDVAFVDWADRGALELVMTAPEGLPVVLRIHSMDALSAWIHLIDWTRVRDLVLVSDHLRDVVVGILGGRLRRTRVHVVPNVLDLTRVPDGKVEGHRRRLLMIGWAQRVKDPLWALQVLASLRADDPEWRLTLVGADFLRNDVTTTQRYADEFVARLLHEDVRDAVDFVGWTDDLRPHLAAAGFVLSTSRRESFGVGLAEGAASGAVPVVRNWPMFATLDGARRLFPPEWVVDTVEEAVDRIREHADDPAWTTASQEARADVLYRFDPGDTMETLRRVVLEGG